ncbi:hypothetical protein CDL15_Pgr021229 [Punica granatum]|uniref:Uncharacterized protein n=1 Tax=Punica granatum TaxID=22663 RepID=A0A218WQX8_PUNGR|nr:hypothetical protein CDL15_Pgr021229 [Punica granatum]PKI68319.1 hypothetical protein CRG98_011227 [Punica granatum]
MPGLETKKVPLGSSRLSLSFGEGFAKKKLNREHNLRTMRRVRVICSDPDATESSSDEEAALAYHKKKLELDRAVISSKNKILPIHIEEAFQEQELLFDPVTISSPVMSQDLDLAL